MAGIPKEHEDLYFDKLCRTQKAETVLSLIQATFHAKRSLKVGENIREEIAKRLTSAYDLFRDNPKGTSSGAGTYSGNYKQFESQYTIGHELCIWANSNLDLTSLATKVAQNEITIKDYFDVFFFNYFQPIKGRVVHPLFLLLSFMKKNKMTSMKKSDIPMALGVACENENINALCNFLDGTNYLSYDGEELHVVGKSVDYLLSKCNKTYLCVDGLEKARQELDTDDKYANYITSEIDGDDVLTEVPNVSIDDLKKKILEIYNEHNYDLTSINKNYEDFKSLFGPNKLSSLEGRELLLTLFAPKDMTPSGMTYHLEHDPKYANYGGIGGGSSYVYPLFYSSSKKSWVSGSARKPRTLSEEEAIEIAVNIRDKLIELCNLVEKNKDFSCVDNYINFEKGIYSGDPVFTRVWVFKYLHLIYPQYFSTFYNPLWINKEIKNLQIDSKGGLYTKNGQISLFSKELNIPNVCFAWVLYELFPNEEIVEKEDESSEEIHMLPTLNPRSYFGHSLNTIIYGAPGTGKTYSTIEYALAIIEKRSINNKQLNYEERKVLMNEYQVKVENGMIVFTTFHQNYGYEDFIQGLRPDTNGDGFRFIPVDGVFKKIADKAMDNPNNNYVLIIDEINRANISKVLGELITLIEEDKRWGELNQLSVTLPSGDVFAVPNNLYILGTMNTADKSISLIDVALRRRFDFVEQKVDYSLISNSLLKGVLLKINNTLADEFESTDLLIGHSYFIDKKEDDFGDVMNKKIIPLLYEYYSDNAKKVESLLSDALKETGFYLCSSKNERLRIKKTEDSNA